MKMNLDYLLKNQFQHTLSASEIVELLESNKRYFIFIKDIRHQYLYSNSNFSQLLGLKNNTLIRGLYDNDLYKDIARVKEYQDYDDQVFDIQKTIHASATLAPKNNSKLQITATGLLTPLYDTRRDRLQAVLGITYHDTQLITQTLDELLKLSLTEVNQLLAQHRYIVNIDSRRISFARREIQCVIGLMQGHSSQSMSLELGLSKLTVDSYIQNLKQKLSVSTKFELIDTIIKYNIFTQIFY